jgi:hypothetical protein
MSYHLLSRHTVGSKLGYDTRLCYYMRTSERAIFDAPREDLQMLMHYSSLPSMQSAKKFLQLNFVNTVSENVIRESLKY